MLSLTYAEVVKVRKILEDIFEKQGHTDDELGEIIEKLLDYETVEELREHRRLRGE